MDESRIVEREWKRQIVDFKGLAYARRIMPTDLDGFLEFGDKLYVFFELKHHIPVLGEQVDTLMPVGQLMALERLVVVVGRQRPALLVEAHHECQPAVDVTAAYAVVHRYWLETPRIPGAWKVPAEPMVLSTLIDLAVNKFAPDCKRAI